MQNSNYGFIRVASAIPTVEVANCSFNVSQMIRLAHEAHTQQASVICFPELSVTAYTCADLFFQQQLLSDAEKALDNLCRETASIPIIIIAGLPLMVKNRLYNCAVVIQEGKIHAAVPKYFLPNNNEFYEKRWFTSGATSPSAIITINNQEVAFGSSFLFNTTKFCFGIELCEDLWMPAPPSSELALQGADIIFNLSASNELLGKHQYLCDLIRQQSARCVAGYVYSSAGHGESSTDLVFGGNAIIVENGSILAKSERFCFNEQLIICDIDVERLRADRLKNSNFFSSNNDKGIQGIQGILLKNNESLFNTLLRTFSKHPFVPQLDSRDENCHEIFSIQVGGLAKRWTHTKAANLMIGISGGLDSTLALLVCVMTADKLGYDRKRIYGITMPGFGTTDRTYNNALMLMQSLGVTILEIPIAEACLQHFKDINHPPGQHDVTYENTQARERTQLLMNIANKHNGLVIGTGDLSELALGWATYNGDHMSMYAVNSGVPKTLVRYLVAWASNQLDKESATVLADVLDTPVSPELLPADENGNIAQKTEDIVGPYELHDFFLYYFVRFGFTPEKIFFLAQHTFRDSYQVSEIQKWLQTFIRRFFSQQFKRSCMPDGPKVGSINLSPRGDWRMPSDAVPFSF